jgi:hypothetical protein
VQRHGVYDGCVHVVLLLLLAASSPRTATYLDRSGDAPVRNVYRVSDADDGGHRVELQLASGIRHVIETDAAWSTVRWTLQDPAAHTDLEARRRGDRVVLAGTHEGGPVHRTYDLEGRSWHQAFPVDLEAFAVSTGTELRFVAIAPAGPSALKLGSFVAERKQTAQVRIGDRAVQAVRLRVGLSGLLGAFWHGDYWHRAGDGRWIRYGGSDAGDPAVSELIAEE